MMLWQALSVSLEKEMKNVLIKVVSSFYTCYSKYRNTEQKGM